ncbi:MAG: hypothetical protein AAGC81_09370 [Pseudomonadota bacterium]
MSAAQPPRGAAPVGYLYELPFLEAAAVQYFRLWCAGPAHQEEVWNDFASTIGPHEGRQALSSLEELCALIAERRRRPLMRHPVHCKLLGADEAVLANLIGAAADGTEHEALLFAALMVDGQRTLSAVRIAERFAKSLTLMKTQCDGPQVGPLHHEKPLSNRLH